jgi:hypothetical protein
MNCKGIAAEIVETSRRLRRFSDYELDELVQKRREQAESAATRSGSLSGLLASIGRRNLHRSMVKFLSVGPDVARTVQVRFALCFATYGYFPA